jgi:hypothetical protein
MNLRAIESAKQQWHLEQNKSAGDAPTWTEITPYLGRVPKCPQNGTYKIGKLSEEPTCSAGGRDHKIPH